jgi:hypothetical protein
MNDLNNDELKLKHPPSQKGGRFRIPNRLRKKKKHVYNDTNNGSTLGSIASGTGSIISMIGSALSAPFALIPEFVKMQIKGYLFGLLTLIIIGIAVYYLVLAPLKRVILKFIYTQLCTIHNALPPLISDAVPCWIRGGSPLTLDEINELSPQPNYILGSYNDSNEFSYYVVTNDKSWEQPAHLKLLTKDVSERRYQPVALKKSPIWGVEMEKTADVFKNTSDIDVDNSYGSKGPNNFDSITKINDSSPLIPANYVIDKYPNSNQIQYLYKKEKMSPDFMFIVFRLKTHEQLQYLTLPKYGEDGYHAKLDPKPKYLFLCYDRNANIKWNTTDNDPLNWELPRYLNMITSEVYAHNDTRNTIEYSYHESGGKGVEFEDEALLFSGFVSQDTNDDNSWHALTNTQGENGNDNPNTLVSVMDIPPVKGYVMDSVTLYRHQKGPDYMFKVYINNDYIPLIYFMTLVNVENPNDTSVISYPDSTGKTMSIQTGTQIQILSSDNLTSLCKTLSMNSIYLGSKQLDETYIRSLLPPTADQKPLTKADYSTAFLTLFLSNLGSRTDSIPSLSIKNGKYTLQFTKQLPISVMMNKSISNIFNNGVNLPNLDFENLPDLMFLTYNKYGKIVWNLIPIDANNVWEYPQYLHIPAHIRQFKYNYGKDGSPTALEYKKDQVLASTKDADNSYGTDPPNGISNTKNLPNIQYYQIDTKYFYEDQGFGQRDYFFKVYTKIKHASPNKLMVIPPIGETRVSRNSNATDKSLFIFTTLDRDGKLMLYGLNNIDDAWLWENTSALQMYTPEMNTKGRYAPKTYDKNKYGGYEFNEDARLIQHVLKIPDTDKDNSYGSDSTSPNIYDNVINLPAINGFVADTMFLYRAQAGRDYIYKVYRNMNHSYPTSLQLKYNAFHKNADNITQTNLPIYIFIAYNSNGDFKIFYNASIETQRKYWEIPKYFRIPAYLNRDSYRYNSDSPQTVELSDKSPLFTSSDNAFSNNDHDNSYGEDHIQYLKTLPASITINLKNGTTGGYTIKDRNDESYNYMYREQSGRDYMFKVYVRNSYTIPPLIDVSIYGISNDVNYLFVCLKKNGEPKIYSLYTDTNPKKPNNVSTQSMYWEYPKYLEMELDQVDNFIHKSGDGPTGIEFNKRCKMLTQMGVSNNNDDNSFGSSGWNSYTYVQRLPQEFTNFKKDGYIYEDQGALSKDNIFAVYINKSFNPSVSLTANFTDKIKQTQDIPNYLYVAVKQNGYPIFNICKDDSIWDSAKWAKDNNKNADCLKASNYEPFSSDVRGIELRDGGPLFNNFPDDNNNNNNSWGNNGRNSWKVVERLPNTLKIIVMNNMLDDNVPHLVNSQKGPNYVPSSSDVRGIELRDGCPLFNNFPDDNDNNSWGNSGRNSWKAVARLPNKLNLIVMNNMVVNFTVDNKVPHLFKSQKGPDYVYKVYKNDKYVYPNSLFPPADVMRDNTKYLFLCYNRDGNIMWNRSKDSDKKWDNGDDVRDNRWRYNSDSPYGKRLEKRAWLFRLFSQPGNDNDSTGTDRLNSYQYSTGSNCIVNVMHIPEDMTKMGPNGKRIGYKHVGQWCYRYQSGAEYIFKIYQNVNTLSNFTNKESFNHTYKPKKQYALIPNLLDDMDLFDAVNHRNR